MANMWFQCLNGVNNIMWFQFLNGVNNNTGDIFFLINFTFVCTSCCPHHLKWPVQTLPSLSSTSMLTPIPAASICNKQNADRKWAGSNWYGSWDHQNRQNSSSSFFLWGGGELLWKKTQAAARSESHSLFFFFYTYLNYHYYYYMFSKLKIYWKNSHTTWKFQVQFY